MHERRKRRGEHEEQPRHSSQHGGPITA
jgi:hypothetical protein